MPTLVIQQISTSWSIESLGGQAAGKRNAVPIVARLEIPDKKSKLLVHTLTYKEDDQFHTPLNHLTTHGSLPMTIGSLLIRQLGPDILVSVRYTHSMGAPERIIRKDIKIVPGDWVQVLYNGRFSDGEADLAYRHEAFNIAYVDEPDSRIFTHSTPKVAFSALTQLH